MPHGSFKNRVLRLFRKPQSPEERLDEMFDQAEREGLIDDETSDMVQGIIDLSTMEVSEIMVPRTRLVALPAESSLTEVIAAATSSGHSRIPVYKGNVDKIAGILHVKDLLKSWGKKDEEFEFAKILRDPYFIPESKPLDDLLADFQEMKIQVAIVVDEYGGTSGLVTLEDILEVIVGEIHDEFDPLRPQMSMVREGEWVKVPALYGMHDLFDEFGIEPPEGDFSTVGGWIFDRVGRIPTRGEAFDLDGYTVRIEEAADRRIVRVAIRFKNLPADIDQEAKET